MKDRIAVLKLAGFKIRRDKIDKLWEWYVPKENSSDGSFRLGKESYTDEESAWDSAWRYMRGDASEEFDNDPWIN